MTNYPIRISPAAGNRRKVILAVLVASALAGCASNYERREVVREVAPPLPPTQVYFYPNAGQSAEQQDRDRFECYLWARKQTGFDPSQPQVSRNVRVEVIPSPPPGYDTAAGAVTGAIIGAAVSRPHDAGEGALVGAVAGAIIGAASDSARQAEAERIESRYNRVDGRHMADLERRAADFRRAMSVCLEGRGYTVR